MGLSFFWSNSRVASYPRESGDLETIGTVLLEIDYRSIPSKARVGNNAKRRYLITRTFFSWLSVKYSIPLQIRPDLAFAFSVARMKSETEYKRVAELQSMSGKEVGLFIISRGEFPKAPFGNSRVLPGRLLDNN